MSDNKELVLNSNEPLTSQKPKKVVHIEMFRAGPQISSTGQKMMFTEQDLDQVVGTYSPEQHEAPLIIGHDQTDSTPALGWVKNLWRKGKALWGNVELTPKAEQLIKDGVFKKVSSSFYLPDAETNPHPGKLALRHLGLVSIPAVKGLSAFSEGEANDEKIVDLVPQSGETIISFKEALETNNSTMTKKKTSDKVKEVSVDQSVDHAEGSMTVNINIGGGKPTVYDDSGNQVAETGAPADYKMEYAADEEETDEEMAPEAEADAPEGEGEGDDMGLEDEGGEEEAPEASAEGEEEEGGEEAPAEGEGEEPAGEEGEEDISGEMEDNDKKIASLAAEYEEDELFQALALKKQASSMMEKDMSYGEMPEGLKKHMEEKKEGEGEDEEEKKEDADMSEEQVSDNAEEVVDNAEETKEEEETKADMAEEEKEEEEEEESKTDMAEEVKEEKKETLDNAEEAAPMATESLDHGESAIGDQSIETLNARVAELEEELNKQRKLAREKEISSFAEGLYESGKLTEQVVPKGDLVRFMETLNYKNSVNFSETGKASQFDFMRGVLESLPSMVSFEEFATPASAPKKSKSVEPNASGYAYDPNTANVHADALSYAEENGCDYLTAVKFVIENNN